MNNRLDNLKIRLENCQKLKQEELSQKQPNGGFLSDVNETIRAIKNEINNITKNPSKGFEMVAE